MDTAEKEKFLGFVLLSECKWSKAEFFEEMKKSWDIDLTESDSKSEASDDDTVVYADYNGMRIITGLMPVPVPNYEAEHFAAANYMWKNAISQTGKQKAHLILTVMGEGSAEDKAVLYVKAAAAALKQSNVLAFYSNGAVYEPKMFCDCAEIIKKGEFPVLNLIWFGVYGNGKKTGFHTYGMRQFGKEELEIYVNANKANLPILREITVTFAVFIIKNNITLQDGDTIGLNEEQKLPVTVSPAVAFKGNSVKIDVLAKKQ